MTSEPPWQRVRAAVRAAPRRHRLPPLPSVGASAQDPEAALAVAIEAARRAQAAGVPAPQDMGNLFTRSLDGMIRRALQDRGGDPAFQALVLRADDASVAEHVQLAAELPVDARAARAIVDAVAHPGKLRSADAALRARLEPLHALARAERWSDLRAAVQAAVQAGLPQGADRTLAQLPAHPALARLERGAALLREPQVQRYLALRAAGGPAAGSEAAAQRGRAAQETGARAEDETLQAFATLAQWLSQAEGEGAERYLAAGALRPPPGFPGDAGRAKDEWDAALLRIDASGVADIVLLAETKASPAAATADWPRLLRGLQRLAQADASASYAFRTQRGEQLLRGASLQAFAPRGDALPEGVLYACSAPPEASPLPLAAHARALLLQERASVAHGVALVRGQPAPAEGLRSLWGSLATAPRLQSVLQQDAVTRAAREAMVHPRDLLAAAAQALGRSESR